VTRNVLFTWTNKLTALLSLGSYRTTTNVRQRLDLRFVQLGEYPKPLNSASRTLQIILTLEKKFWLLGALLPIAFYVLHRVVPNKRLRFLHAPVMLGAMAWLPPATPLSFSSWAIVGLIFNYWIRRRWNGWWTNYNVKSC